MKLTKIAATLVLSTVTALPVMAKDSVPTTDQEKLSYSLGALLGMRVKSDFNDLNVSMVSAGMSDILSDKKPAIDQAKMLEIIQKAQQEAAAKAQQKMIEEAQKNLEKGNAFLKTNGKKAGVITTDTGLQYSIIKEGKGAKPTKDSEVTVHYEGKLLNGKVFDSSYERGQPATFRVNQVIAGWTEALQMMPEGSTWELYIPSDLAYGPGGAPQGSIGPNELLTFKVELIKVTPPAEPVK